MKAVPDPRCGRKTKHEYRWYSACTDCSILTKTQKEWSFIKTVGKIRQIRIPVEREAEGKDITPDVEIFLKKGSRRKPKPIRDESEGSDIQDIGMITDRELMADELWGQKENIGQLKTVCIMYWTILSARTGHRQKIQK